MYENNWFAGVAVWAHRRNCGKQGKRSVCRGVYTPGVLQKSAEFTDYKGIAEILFFEECARI
jgi:hypothetical protein